MHAAAQTCLRKERGLHPLSQPSLHGSPLHNYVETLLATIQFGCSHSNPWHDAQILLQPSRGGNRLQVANSLSVYNIHVVCTCCWASKSTSCDYLSCVCLCVCVYVCVCVHSQEENFGDLLMLRVQIRLCVLSRSVVSDSL